MATSAKEWKKKSKKEHELTVPSGNVCLVRRPGPALFAELSASIPNALLSEVMPLLEDAKEKGKTEGGEALPPGALNKLQDQIVDNPSMIADMIELVDAVALRCVVSPELAPVSERERILNDQELTEEEKQEKLDELLFVDEVDFEDKMFIFQFVSGGTRDFERFRSGTQELVAARQDGEEVP